jgi:hypothetical protein
VPEIEETSGVLWMPNLWWPVSIGFCPSQVEWDKLMKRSNIHDAFYPEIDRKGGATFSGFPTETPDHYPFGVITVAEPNDKGDPSTACGVLVHESVHAFQFICHKMGEAHPSHEFEAYGIQAIYLFMEREYSRTRWSKSDGKEDPTAKDHRSPAKEVRARARKGVP